MVRVIDRTLQPGEASVGFVWDIDKTYLDTRFSQLKHLARIPFEFGIDKRALPGAVALLHALRGAQKRPLWFVSASPPVLGKALERKMLLDGVEWDGITYKDVAGAVKQGGARRLRHQLAFKLSALVTLAHELPDGVKLHLFGDDVEQDALIYSLFADLVAGRLRNESLARALGLHGVHPREARALVDACDELPAREVVEQIHIRLERHPDGETIAPFPGRVVGHRTFGDAARELERQGVIGKDELDGIEVQAGVSGSFFGQADDDGWFVPRASRG